MPGGFQKYSTTTSRASGRKTVFRIRAPHGIREISRGRAQSKISVTRERVTPVISLVDLPEGSPEMEPATQGILTGEKLEGLAGKGKAIREM